MLVKTKFLLFQGIVILSSAKAFNLGSRKFYRCLSQLTLSQTAKLKAIADYNLYVAQTVQFSLIGQILLWEKEKMLVTMYPNVFFPKFIKVVIVW